MSIAEEYRKKFDAHLKIDKVFNKTLYKYTDISGSFHILGNKTLLFTNPENFNDPLDCYEGLIDYKYSLPELKEAIKLYVEPKFAELNAKEREKIMHILSNPEVAGAFQSKVILEMKSKIGVCCFSKKKKNILMWSHYAKNHTGFCLGFKPEIAQTNFYSIFPVLYEKEIKVIDKQVNFKEAMLHWVLTKAKNWKYEKEFRAVSLEKNGVADIDPLIVTEIYFGCKFPKDQLSKFEKIIRADFKHAKIYQMEIDRASFKLNPKEIMMD